MPSFWLWWTRFREEASAGRRQSLQRPRFDPSGSAGPLGASVHALQSLFSTKPPRGMAQPCLAQTQSLQSFQLRNSPHLQP